MATLLPFQRTLLNQMLEDDAVCVLAPGLGLHQIVAVLLRLQDVRRTDPEQKGIVLVIGASPWQRTALRQEMDRIHPVSARYHSSTVEPGRENTLPSEITADIATSERLRLYRTCSCVFVTTRILVVDLLSERLLPADITGIVVLNAHRVSDASGEGFAVRLYRDGNASGFVRGFSDAPVAFSSEFGKTEKVLKALQVRRMHLWPRFQAVVQEDLEARPPELLELSLPCDRGAALIYEGLMELVDCCVKELRRHERLDATDLVPSQGLSSALDETIRRQLAPVWHTIGPKTRQMVSDLRTLRTLASYLNKLDPITFLMYLETLRATEGMRAAWLFHSAAHTVFEAAKARVYKLMPSTVPERKRKADGLPESTGTAPMIQPVLDELPKWQALQEILDEVKRERPDSTGTDTVKYNPPKILVFCQDEYTCAQLREIVGPEGPAGLLQRTYLEFLQYKIDSGVRTPGNQNAAAASDGRSYPHAPRMMGGYAAGEEAALLKEARGFGAVRAKNIRGRGRGGSRGRGRRHVPALNVKNGRLGDKAEESGEPAMEKDAEESAPLGKKTAESIIQEPEGIRFVAMDVEGGLPLWIESPVFVVIYDPDVALTRSIELFKAQRPGSPLRVYLLRYEDSPEMDKYQASVVRERNAFENLIRAKAHMALPTTTAGALVVEAPGGTSQQNAALGVQGPARNALTRKAGGRILTEKKDPPRIIVDVREFMSSLPAVLHSKGFQLIPVTLEVGDYVLSPEICVERKTLNDLRGSLISGRLYQQAEAMCRYYKTAILLIEFDGDRAFALQGAGELGDDIQVHSLMSRLTLLCLHQPRLRLIWSRSLHATADIYYALKSNHEEPDAITAATVGVARDELGAVGETSVNAVAIDVLRRLPGVNEGNWRALMREGKSLAGLGRLPLERLTSIMGGELPAKRLHDFLTNECRALFASL